MIEISGIKLSLKQGVNEAHMLSAVRAGAARILHVQPRDIDQIELWRRSIDARNKKNVHLLVTARISMGTQSDDEVAYLRVPESKRTHIALIEPEERHFPVPLSITLTRRPVVVGAGCAGLFCALYLAEAGLEPLLIERGDASERRTKAIERFNATGELDPESNIQFGLGGAGTFSDGKLTTGTKNPAHRLILETFVKAGAPRDILWDAKPHIGSDILPKVVETITKRIRTLGGEVRFRCRLVDFERSSSGAIKSVTLQRYTINGTPEGSEERLTCSRVVLACGHSARDVFELLNARGCTLQRKTFAMGVRIEHLQRAIDRAQYGTAAGHPALGAAPYKLVAHPRDARTSFTFCMCPGGEVVAAASETGGVVTNGASKSRRDGVNANAALLVNVNPDDLPGDSPLAGVELQRSCEQAAYLAGGGAYRAPAQLVGDFLQGVASSSENRVNPTYPRGVTWTTLNGLLPNYILEGLRAGIPLMDRKLHGFAAPDAVLTGVETRSSAPITVVRDNSLQSVNTPGLFPCGEGAGYAGGIMSAATDGIRVAEALIASTTRS